MPYKMSAQNGSKVIGDNGRVYSLHVNIVPCKDITKFLEKKGILLHFFRGTLRSYLNDLTGSKDNVLSCPHAHGIPLFEVKRALVNREG